MNPAETPNTSIPATSTTGPRKGALTWRILRFCLLGLATLVTVFVLYHVEENWRGKRAWTQYRDQMEKQGAAFNISELAPPQVPDDQNFAMTPLLKPLLDTHPPDTFDTNGSRLTWKDPEGITRAKSIIVNFVPEGDAEDEGFQSEIIAPRSSPNWRLGERFDLDAWQQYYRTSMTSTGMTLHAGPGGAAADVLEALSRYNDELAELKQAAERPYSRFNIQYEEENPYAILLPHLSPLRNIARVVRLRAVSELRTGHVEAAFEDVNLLFALADSIREEPLLLSHLVRMALLNLAMQTVWEGLADHHWTSTQLEHFQQALTSAQLMTGLRRGMEGERAFGFEMVELIARKPAIMMDFEIDPNRADHTVGMLMRLLPRGWWHLEGVNYGRIFDEHLMAVLPEDPRDLDVQRIKSGADKFDSMQGEQNLVSTVLQHRLLIQLLMPALQPVIVRTVETETLLRLAVTAIGLERYRLENGVYPETLAALAPGWISHVPNDPVTHDHFHYERVSDDAFGLWAVGWDGEDGGGVVSYSGSGSGRRLSQNRSDWVWPSTAGMRLKKASD